MDEQKFQVFIDSVVKYFNQLKSDDVVVQTPYLTEKQEFIVYDFTGVIGITGNKKGLVYFSAPTKMLNMMLKALGETDTSEAILVDLVGEVANTIAGNARTEFGADFNISIPFVFKGAPDNIMLPKDKNSFIIPIDWKDETAAIVVCLQS